MLYNVSLPVAEKKRLLQCYVEVRTDYFSAYARNNQNVFMNLPLTSFGEDFSWRIFQNQRTLLVVLAQHEEFYRSEDLLKRIGSP